MKANKNNKKSIISLFLLLTCLIVDGCTEEKIFSSVEDAYRNQYAEQQANITLILEGENSTLVVGTGVDGVDYYNAYLKNGNEWHYKQEVALNKIKSNYSRAAVVTLYQYKHVDDYYLQIMSNKETTIEIVDNKETVFWISKNGQKFKTYYGYLKSLDEDYELYIDGEQINLQ